MHTGPYMPCMSTEGAIQRSRLSPIRRATTNPALKPSWNSSYPSYPFSSPLQPVPNPSL